MYLTVKSIDFASKTVAVEVDRVMTPALAGHLADFLGYCAYLGFAISRIHHPANMPTDSLATLQRLESKPGRPGFSLHPSGDNPSTDDGSTCRFACVGRFEPPGRLMEYEFACWELSTVLDDLTTAVLIVGYSVPLDESCLSRLRLCLYELGANTLEHGRFVDASPEIRVTLAVGEDCIIAKYSDTAHPFSTLSSQHIDIAERIRRKNKRGLGLCLLNKITEGLSYERRSEWNHTSFIIDRIKNAPHDPNRRNDMNELSISVTNTDCQDTVVLRPAGSINSSTVARLDASFNELLQGGRTTIVLDLSQTEFISSSGVGLLLGTVSGLREKGGDLVLMKLPKLVNDIFEVLNIKMHFRIIGDMSELKAAAKR